MGKRVVNELTSIARGKHLTTWSTYQRCLVKMTDLFGRNWKTTQIFRCQMFPFSFNFERNINHVTISAERPCFSLKKNRFHSNFLNWPDWRHFKWIKLELNQAPLRRLCLVKRDEIRKFRIKFRKPKPTTIGNET